MTELAAHPLPAHSKGFTIMMAMLISIVAISIDAMLPALGMVKTDFALVNANSVQYVVTYLFIGMALGQLICGPLSDALGRKPVLYFGLALYLVGSVLCYLSTSFTMLLAGRLLQGLGVAGPYVSAVSIVRDKFSGRHMARVMSIIMMIFILVPAIAPSLGQGILYLASWREIFLLYIVYSSGIVLWMMFKLEETLPPDRRIPFKLASMGHAFKEVCYNRTTLCYTLCMGICFGSFLGYLNSSQQIFQVQFASGDMFTVYFGCLALVLGAASLVNSRFVERLGMRLICMRATQVIIATSLLFLAVHYLTDVTLWMFLMYAAGLFFCFGLMFGNLNAIAMEPMGHIAGIASAVIGSVSSLISMALGAIIGQLYDNTLIPIILGFSGLGVLSAVIMRFANQGHHPVAVTPQPAEM